MIHLQGIELKRGSKTVFDGLTVAIHGGQRVGVVGRNGIGKSSLFALVRERLLPDEGEVKVPGSWVIAHLEQEATPSERNALDYVVDPAKAADFAEAASRYLPALRAEMLAPDYAGIRPRLAGPGEAPRDFVVQEESDAGLPGFVNLIGIESPGLTAALAIGEEVAALLRS